MKRFPAYVLVVLLMAASMASCTKDECVEPKQPAAGETKALLRGDDGAATMPGMVDQRQRDPQAMLRSSDDISDPGDGEGTGISDDGDDTNDTEKSNRKGN